MTMAKKKAVEALKAVETPEVANETSEAPPLAPPTSTSELSGKLAELKADYDAKCAARDEAHRLCGVAEKAAGDARFVRDTADAEVASARAVFINAVTQPGA
jgi:hypothetical protein